MLAGVRPAQRGRFNARGGRLGSRRRWASVSLFLPRGVGAGAAGLDTFVACPAASSGTHVAWQASAGERVLNASGLHDASCENCGELVPGCLGLLVVQASVSSTAPVVSRQHLSNSSAASRINTLSTSCSHEAAPRRRATARPGPSSTWEARLHHAQQRRGSRRPERRGDAGARGGSA